MDLIGRQAAIDALRDWYDGMIISSFRGIEKVIKALPSAQAEERTEEHTETHACDCISRQGAIDADELMELLTTAIRNMKGIAKFIGAEDDPEIKMKIKAYTDIANWVKDAPTIEPERKTGQLDNDHIWNELSKVYNMDAVPDEAKSIIGDVMLGLGEQPEPVWHECFDDDPASFPDNERNVLVSFSNFDLSIIGQWRVDEDGAGCWYLGDTDETFLSEDLYVDGWWELPKKPEGRE